MDYRLNKVLKNELFEAAQRVALPVRDFRWVDSNASSTDTWSRLEHVARPADFYMEFAPGARTDYSVSLRPGIVRPLDNYTTTWGGLSSLVSSWALTVAAELEAPDLWELASSDARLTSKVFADEQHLDEAFTPRELENIRSRLQEIAEYAKKVSNGDELTLSLIASRVEYLIEASRRSTRRDYTILAYGVLLDLGLHVVSSSEWYRGFVAFGLRLLGEAIGSSDPSLL